MIVAVDDRFVVAIPTTMKVTGFFQANTNALILPELRSDVARRLVVYNENGLSLRGRDRMVGVGLRNHTIF
jgi:hypothetical protein